MNRAIVALRLKALRGEHTQAEIAEKLGISVSVYCMYETGARMPSDNVKIKIAKLYGKSVQEIFFDFDDTNSEQEVE